ncbi:LuxR family transcriptional regulator [Cellulomonas sp. HZM]|uniref:helix-turn-helix transcriptional regulator n=1 Tax=Cellulomonas sp. HZM TaxID=1454010 RepID=UPI0018CC4944|nr:LuxR family transcriptional regulator [Cellulomonas sp. HZM]
MPPASREPRGSARAGDERDDRDLPGGIDRPRAARRPRVAGRTRTWVMPASRRDAVEALRAALRDGRSVLVVGEAGVGKTALAARALDEMTIDGRAPYVVALSGAAGRAGLPLSALEPLLGDEGLLAIGSFARTVRTLSDSLAALSAGSPLVLRVDDAHLLDVASAQALGWLVRQGDVLLVATSRPSGAAGSPWLELWKDDVVDRIDVEPFTVDELEHWLAGELAGTPTADTVRRLWGETRGNVFHARELVRAERSSGALREFDGVWVWTGRAASGARLLELVENDVSRLSAEAHRALEVVALLCPAPMSLLLDVVPRAAVDELVHMGVATMRPQLSAAGGTDVVVDLAHALYAEAVRARVPGGRRREVLDLVAGSTHASTGASLVRSVMLAMDSGLDVGPGRLDAAIEEAFTLQQADVVVRLVDLALRAGTLADAQRARLTIVRAEAWWSQSEFARASRDASDVVRLVRASGTPDAELASRHSDAVQILAATMHSSGADITEVLELVDEAAAWLTSVDALGTWADELAVTRLVRQGWAGQSAATRTEALAVLAHPTSPAVALRLVAPTVISLADSGRFAEAFALCARYLPVSRAHGERYRWATGEITLVGMLASLWQGDVSALRVDALHAVQDEAVPVDWVAAQAGRGLAGVAHGSWSQAATDLRAANARLRVSDRGGIASFTLAAEALAVAASGSSSSARQLLAGIAGEPLRAASALEPEIRLLVLDTLGWLRDPGLTVEAAALATWAASRGHARVELEALHRLVRAGNRSPDVLARVAELATVVEGSRAASVAAHVTALVHDDPDLSRIAERDLNRAGLWLPPLEPPVALTPREREIASLAAGGMTSRAIAARLTLSVRTVDSHLARVFAKTGVHSREGLAEVLR